ncbi:MAG TPA: RluA family pseudouridine synthase, partial [Archangium sp.]
MRGELITWLEPQPSERPRTFPSPFDDVAPHALAQRCAELVMADLRTGFIAEGISTSVLERAEGGKMFGVLVVESQGRVGFLRAISGQLERAWTVEGYVPAAFDAERRVAQELPAEIVVKDFTARVDAERVKPALLEARKALVQLDVELAAQRAELKARHAERKQARKEKRGGASSTSSDRPDASTLHQLDEESRRDDTERRRFEASARDRRAVALAILQPLERRLAALERLRRLISREAMRRIWDSYQLTNFANEQASLLSLFPAGDPPSGAADCAAPKLLAAARAMKVKPLALAEFWWGAPPPGGGRVAGMYVPACKEKCGPVLPFLLRGLDVAPRQTWKPRAVREDELVVVHEDARFLVLDKP